MTQQTYEFDCIVVIDWGDMRLSLKSKSLGMKRETNIMDIDTVFLN